MMFVTPIRNELSSRNPESDTFVGTLIYDPSTSPKSRFDDLRLNLLPRTVADHRPQAYGSDTAFAKPTSATTAIDVKAKLNESLFGSEKPDDSKICRFDRAKVGITC